MPNISWAQCLVNFRWGNWGSETLWAYSTSSSWGVVEQRFNLSLVWFQNLCSYHYISPSHSFIHSTPTEGGPFCFNSTAGRVDILRVCPQGPLTSPSSQNGGEKVAKTATSKQTNTILYDKGSCLGSILYFSSKESKTCECISSEIIKRLSLFHQFSPTETKPIPLQHSQAWRKIKLSRLSWYCSLSQACLPIPDSNR